MTDIALPTEANALGEINAHEEIVSEWIHALDRAMASRNSLAVAELFQPEGVARDLLALTWDFRNAVGREEVAALLTGSDSSTPSALKVRAGAAPIFAEEDGQALLSSFLQFRTSTGAGFGHVTLLQNEDSAWRASSFVLALDSIDSHPERIHDARPSGKNHGPVQGRLSWREGLDPDFVTQEPAVLILGAGHNGLMLGARLRSLGVPALIVEQNDRVGDNWRKRYSSLALHTPLAADHLPYLPFPSSWPRFTPKDKLGDFLESYATLLDLPVWTGTNVQGAEFDDLSGRWSVDTERSDGTRRKLRPRHLVFATGMNAAPYLPSMPGQDAFEGKMIHAVDYQGHSEWQGKRAVVIGSGVSGHDIAQDLAEHGVEVTMIQRSGTFVMNTSTFHTVMHSNHTNGVYSTEDADLVNAATPFGALPAHGPKHVKLAKAMDHELLEGLTAAGFELSDGPGGQGVLGLIFGQNATGYYYNAGASELIIDGTIKLRHGSVESLTARGVMLESGKTIDADLVVFATGYRGAPTVVREVLGDDVARRVGEFAKVSDDREYGRLWRRNDVDQLWFMISLGIGDGRFYSKLLALQLAAIEAGTVPARLD